MDPEWLEAELEKWVAEGVIDEEQAVAIRNRYPVDDASTDRSRLVLAISLMGAALIGVGITVYLSANWETLPRWFRTGILLIVPVGSYLIGAVVERRFGYSRVGHALLVLAIGFVGLSAFMMDDLYRLGLDDALLFACWSAVAIPAAHGHRSRPMLAIGLVVAGATIVSLTEPSDPIIPVAFFGVVLFGLGAFHDRKGAAWASGTYRIVGAGGLLVALLLVTALDGRLGRIDDLGGWMTITTGGAATAVAASLGLACHGGRHRCIEFGWVAIGILVLSGVLSLTVAIGSIPSRMAVLLLVHLLVLVVLVATVAVGYELGTTGPVNLSAIGFLVQVLMFIESTILGSLPTALALIVAGLLLLVAGIALERTRRRILGRMRADGT